MQKIQDQNLIKKRRLFFLNPFPLFLYRGRHKRPLMVKMKGTTTVDDDTFLLEKGFLIQSARYQGNKISDNKIYQVYQNVS